MTPTQAQMEVKKDGIRQTQSGEWKLSLTIHPNDFSSGLAMAPMGTRYMCVLVEIADDGTPAIKPDAAPAHTPREDKERTPFKQLPRSQQAALKCQDPEFIAWLRVSNEGQSRETVCAKLGISSRAELLTNKEAADKWDAMLTDFDFRDYAGSR